jgi:hypothetical protein
MNEPRVAAGMLALALATATACGGGGAPPKYAITGTLGIPSSAVVGSNLIFADAAINGSPQHSSAGLVIDSGSPVVLLDPTFFGLPAPATASDVLANVDLGLMRDGAVVVTVQQIPVVQLSAAMMDENGLAGILGGNVLRQFSVQLDYAAPMGYGLCLGCTAAARDDVAADAAIPFNLRGGLSDRPLILSPSAKPTISTPATRVPVTVTIEGTDYPFILDTGASEVSMVGSALDALMADGRPRLTDFPITTVTGSSGATVTRAKSISVGGQVVTDVPVMADSNIDGILGGISQEVGSQIEGLLGGSFLRNFLVTVDYPGGRLHLQPYTTQTWHDEFKRVGIALAQTPSTSQHWYAVGFVYPGTDAAAKGILQGNLVLSIDGTSLDGIDPIAADQLLDGTVGTTKSLVIADSNTATPVTVQVLVDDLIPSP